MKLYNFLILSFFILNSINTLCSELDNKLRKEGLAMFLVNDCHAPTGFIKESDKPTSDADEESKLLEKLEKITTIETYMPEAKELKAQDLKDLFGDKLGTELFNQINSETIFSAVDVSRVKECGQEKVAKFVVILKNAALFAFKKAQEIEVKLKKLEYSEEHLQAVWKHRYLESLSKSF